MKGVPQLLVKLLYGSGLRITEAVRLRVQDVETTHVPQQGGQGVTSPVDDLGL
ncbi:hypothetical protein [Methylomonas sp.]|jgi:site-specific recombinase XerD|uniref:hypothetical protein n=1 Tax=Methylomonas sp. TaxID=418 RepID=UPI0034184EEF